MTNDCPLVSIVTISFNQAEFLEQTILSVLSQDYPNIEYIVMDPGSTDGSREIIEQYKSQLAHVGLGKDAGPADGLNNGFSNANGKIFAYLNSDDLLLPGAVTAAVKELEAKPDCDAVIGHVWAIDEKGERIRRLYSDPVNLTGIAHAAFVQMQIGTFVRAEAFHGVGGFNPENRIAWDGELVVDMALKGSRFAIINQFWGSFRIHQESITGAAKMQKDRAEYVLRIFQKITGRRPGIKDRIGRVFYLLLKYLITPRALMERLHKGSVFGVAK